MYSFLKPEKRAALLSKFCDFFVDEFLREYSYLEDLSRGNTTQRQDPDLLKVVLRIGTSLLRLVPFAGGMLAEVLPSINKIMSEAKALQSYSQSYIDTLNEFKEAYAEVDNIASEYKEYKSATDLDENSKNIVDPEALKLLARHLSLEVAQRYEFIIVNLLKPTPETLLPFAREGARRVWNFLIHDINKKTDKISKTLNTSKSLLEGLFHEKKIEQGVWDKFSAKWQRFNAGVNLPLRDVVAKELKKEFLIDKRLYACVAFYDQNQAYYSTFTDVNKENNEALYGYAWIANKKQLPRAEWDEKSLPGMISGTWEKTKYFRCVTANDVKDYLENADVKTARSQKKTARLLFSSFICKKYNYTEPCYFFCKDDLSALEVAYGNFEAINFTGSRFKGDLSGASFKRSTLQGCIFDHVYTNEKDMLDCSLAILSGSRFINKKEFSEGIKAVNFTHTVLHFVDMGNTIIALNEVTDAQWYKANLQNIRSYNITQAQLDLLKKTIADQVKAQELQHEVEQKQMHVLENSVNKIWENVQLLNDQQRELAAHQDTLIYLRNYCEKELMNLQKKDQKQDESIKILEAELERIRSLETAATIQITVLDKRVNDIEMHQKIMEKSLTQPQRTQTQAIAATSTFTAVASHGVVHGNVIDRHIKNRGPTVKIPEDASNATLNSITTLLKAKADLIKMRPTSASSQIPKNERRVLVDEYAEVKGDVIEEERDYDDGDIIVTPRQPTISPPLAELAGEQWKTRGNTSNKNDGNTQNNSSQETLQEEVEPPRPTYGKR